MEQLLQLLKTIPEYKAILSSLSEGESVAVTGIGQINRSHMIAGLCRDTTRPVVVICQDDMAARRLQEELKGFLGDTAPILPSRELTLYDAAVVSRSWEQNRLRQLYDLAAGKTPLLLTGWEDEPFVDLPLEMPAGLPGPLDAQNDVRPLGNAIIYYAFDDTVNSSRYPSYLTMQEAWNGWGLSTTLDTDVTVADLRHIDDYDLCILSTHGAYYTYTTGWLFKQVRTAPVLLLREESSFWDDLRYGFDLLTHRVIKVNGNYCVTPDFFSAAYRDGQLEGTMVFSETCEFFGGSNILDLSMSNALLDAGARAVVGFVNNVYAVYSRNMLWGTVNQLIMGKNILQAVDAAAATYGPDDIYWYLSQGGTKPHRYAAFALVHGDDTATLYTLDQSAAA